LVNDYRLSIRKSGLTRIETLDGIALSGSATDAVDTWIQSTEHRINLEGNYDLTGVGVVKAKTGSSFYATQILIKP